MPIHDWTLVEAGLFHAFHQRWIGDLCVALNNGLLPKDCFALQEQVSGGPIPDVLSLRLAKSESDDDAGGIGAAVMTAPVKTRIIKRSEADIYARKADRVVVRHKRGHVISMIEIVSPGNKSSRGALRDFVDKSIEMLRQGVHLLVVDLFPPSKRDPQEIHKAIWDEIEDDDFELPTDKPLTLVSYSASPVKTAYVEPVAVGDPLPEMPLFLDGNGYVRVPLEATYGTTWSVFPNQLKGLLSPSSA